MNEDFTHNLRALIKTDEGWSATPYQDTKGVWTIGFGTNITKINKEEGEALLDIRLQNCIEHDLIALDPEEIAVLNDARLIVYISMLYNIGLGSFCGFKNMRQGVRDQDWDKAADNILWNDVPINTVKSQYYNDVKGRAERLADIMRSGNLNDWMRGK